MNRKIISFAVCLALMLSLAVSACSAQQTEALTNIDEIPEENDNSLPGTKLIIATIKEDGSLFNADAKIESVVSKFNADSQRYSVEIINYAEGGLSAQDALKKLNTELVTGKCQADMLCFSKLSPLPYISKGLLTDMAKLIDEDRSIVREDIAAFNAMTSFGGLYFLDNSFTFETLIGKNERFGDIYGWTLQDYLDIEADVSPNTWLIYNITQEYFLKQVASRYARTAIDWEKATCNFDNNEFVDILSMGSRIENKPESEDNVLYGSGGVYVGTGQLIAASVYVNSIYALASEQRNAGCKLSYIGWPTADGRCGTEIDLNCPVGILTQTDQLDGCWEFMKYLLKSEETERMLPLYMPRLMEELEKAKIDEEAPVKLTDEDIYDLLGVVSAIENVSISDNTVNGIIYDELEKYINREKTAEETAKLIQSKVSIYLAEQG